MSDPRETSPPFYIQHNFFSYGNPGGYSEADQLSFLPGSLATAGHGAWASTGKRTFLLTYENFTCDKGKATGTSKVRQTTLLGVDGKTYVGHGDFAYFDLNGKPIPGYSGKFTFKAKKILLEKPQ